MESASPIGIGGHFPPGVPFTPQVDLFAIENTNRDTTLHPGPNGTTVALPARFNVNAATTVYLNINVSGPTSLNAYTYIWAMRRR